MSTRAPFLETHGLARKWVLAEQLLLGHAIAAGAVALEELLEDCLVLLLFGVKKLGLELALEDSLALLLEDAGSSTKMVHTQV